MATETTAAPLNLHQRVLAIMKSVAYVQKEDRKVNQQYTFVSHDAVVGAVRAAMVEHGVVSTVDVVARKQEGTRTEVDIEMSFINVDTPEDRFMVHGFGYGIDPQDKGPGKAISYAVKYVLLKVFMLETGDDPERDNVDHKPKSKDAETPKSQAQPPKQANGNGAPKQAEIPPAPAENPDKAIALTVFGEVVALAESMGYTKTEVGDMYKAVYNAKTAGTVSHATAIDIKRDMAAKAALWPQIRDAVLATYFDPQAFDPTLDREKALLVDKTRDVLADKASLEYASRPLRAKAGVWQEWKTEISQKATAAA